nr:zinc finger BED domain-containing protein RICESLEEPER 2-like [Lolium perenne]XP_051184073.1 zinc finger BED domain-containing protein RICESLEEPER 2-like [Lolium perenne]
MVVTAHYIDESWNLKSFLLRFAYVPCPHNGEVICQALYECLVDWHLEGKVSTITLDNCTSNDKAVEELTDKLNTQSLMLNGKYLHMCCCAHVLNLIVKDGMNVLEKGIGRVRDSVAYWSATPKRHERFEKMAKTLNIAYTRRLNLDCKTRWNSTYIMLDIALQYIPIFEKLNKREKLFAKENCCPTDEDWNFARELCERLKVFFDITVLFSGTKYVTANLFFPKISAIRLSIRKWSTSDDPLIKKMYEEMKTKFEKYWKDVHGLMAIATVLDPRYKLHMLQALFGSLYGYEYANREVERIRNLMVDLLEEYQPVGNDGCSSKHGSVAASSVGTDEAMQIFSAYMSSQPVVTASRVRTELDLYLEEPNIPMTTELDIIGWWKFGGIKYPTLQRMAHDILPIPVTTVAF